ncbi:CPBP family intramembrane glutamic endopeptidase [Halosimplex aquaticum]|uniref:CPBP family intramembrane glutamic endopeptidase n=1 Tax=Halosimplex aquaticum TaxID=3026162 RepID=A0ABD5XXV6_9EURY|nr:CPBP family intramembrane glutamic endopeptidase [Halosimplex aquaticum]
MSTRERSLLRTAVALVSAIGLGAGGLLLGFVLVGITVGVLVAGLNLDLPATAQIVLSLVFIQGVGCAGVAFAYLRLRPVVGPKIRSILGYEGVPGPFDIDAAVPSLRQVAIVVGGYVLALGGAFAGSILVTILQVDTGTNQAAQMGMENPAILLILIPASILIIGPGEELLFRGVVQGRLREVFGPVLGVLIPSAVFAGLHWFALTGGSATGNLVALGVLVGPALVFGAAYELTDNIVVPALIHGIYNATLFSLLYVVVAFSDQLPDPQNSTAAVLALL